MPLHQLVYVSRSTDDLSAGQVAVIADAAADANLGRDVTGMLLYCRGCFLQLLEGEEATLRPLFLKIGGDPRHVDVHLLSCAAAAKRLFPAWGMSHAHLDSARVEEAGRVREVIAKLRALRDFADVGDDARDLIRELRRTIDGQSALRRAA